ncbi:MAG TPA: HisA/HisF-related TIM barrel protein [Gemmatales bacterium]|nr:HisA/HisF-related TIM barrel protein [Gemmatales bacterium]
MEKLLRNHYQRTVRTPDCQQTQVITLPESLLPVLDLQQGRAVQAYAGIRSNYQPLQSRWMHGAEAISVKTLLHNMRVYTGFREFYVADLDAICSVGDHRELIEELLAEGYQLWLDAGLRRPEDAVFWLNRGVQRVIVASETMEADTWDFSSDRLVFSLDLYRGSLRSKRNSAQSPLQLLEQVVDTGCQTVIVLDTAIVGTRCGCPTLELCESILKHYPCMEVITGGGIRNREDIQTLEKAGIKRILVSTWLHDPNTVLS